MKISHVKVLITFLYHIDTTFPETIKIIRPLEGKKWKYGIDSFHIPQSVCNLENSGNRGYCNTTSCSMDETGNYSGYLCSCSKENSTVTYFKDRWRCMENKEVRKQLGCGINATLFTDEMEKSNLRTLDPDWSWPKRKTKLINPRGSCKINVSSSWYIGCLGEKIPLGLLTKKTTKMFFLLRMSKKKPTSRPYFIKVSSTIDPILRGKVINLGITCKSSTHIAEGCLLFKLKGNLTCPVHKSTVPMISSTIHPTTSSLVVTSLSTAIRPRLGGKQHTDEVSSSSHSGIIAGVTALAAILLLLVAVLFIYRRRRSRKDTNTSTSGQTNQQVLQGLFCDQNTISSEPGKSHSVDGAYAAALNIPKAHHIYGPGHGNAQKPDHLIKTISSEGNSHSDGAYAAPLNIPKAHHIYGPGNAQKPDHLIKTMSSEGNSHSDGAYAALNTLEEHHIYGPGNAQKPVNNVLKDPKIMFENYGPGIDQVVYYALEDLSVKDSGKPVNNRPTTPGPDYNVPEVMFQSYGSGIDQPLYYASEDILVRDSGGSVKVRKAPGLGGAKKD